MSDHSAARDVLLQKLAMVRYKQKRANDEIDTLQKKIDRLQPFVDQWNAEADEIAQTLHDLFGIKKPNEEAGKLGEVWQIT